ncbi:MAG TPA: hypothetical protein ENI23_11710, partial [bacterium]|nr:hypothetical protein [bacterium]
MFKQLMPHQKEAINFLMGNKIGVLHHGTGAGKTVSALSTYRILANRQTIKRVLIISTVSGVTAFRADLLEFWPEMIDFYIWEDLDEPPPDSAQVVILTPNRLKSTAESAKVPAWPGSRKMVNQITRINFDITQFDTLILDEVHKYVTPGSFLSDVLSYIRPAFQYIWCLTATPMGSKIEPIYGIGNLFYPGVFGSFWTFKDKYCKFKIKRARGRNYQEVVGYKNLEQLSEQIAPWFHKYHPDYDIRFYEHRMELSDHEKPYVIKAIKGIFDEKKQKEIPATKLHDLQKAVDFGDKNQFTAKMWKLQELMDENEGGLVLFSHKETLHYLHEQFQHRYDLAIITGDVNLQKRIDVQEWLEPKKRKWVFMTAAGGESLNLHAVNNVIVFDIPYSPTELAQAIGRVARMTSKYDHFNAHFLIVDSTIDEYKYNLLGHYKGIIEQILSGKTQLPDQPFVSKDMIIWLRRSLLWRNMNPQG